MKEHNSIAVIILGAGSSSRMGRVKQLLPWNDSTMIKHAIKQAKNSEAEKVIVVLGANRDIIKPEIESIANINVVENKNWKNGMLTSLQAGIQQVNKNSDAVLITLVDQPSINSEYINRMIKEFKSGDKSIITTKYKNAIGVPALFYKSHYNNLVELNLESGGPQKYIKDNIHKAGIIEPEFEVFDIDTEDEYNKYYKI